jgi:hypothetical protein
VASDAFDQSFLPIPSGSKYDIPAQNCGIHPIYFATETWEGIKRTYVEIMMFDKGSFPVEGLNPS